MRNSSSQVSITRQSIDAAASSLSDIYISLCRGKCSLLQIDISRLFLNYSYELIRDIVYVVKNFEAKD